MNEPAGAPGGMVELPIEQALRLAHVLEAAGQAQEADALLARMLRAAPARGDVLGLAGVVAFGLGRQEEGVALLERAIAHGVEIAPYLRNISEMYRRLGRIAPARAAAEHALRLAPNNAHALLNYALLLLDSDEPDAAIAIAGQALLIAPDMAEAHLVRGEALLLKGDWAAGWEDYEWRFGLRQGAGMMPTTKRPKWDGAPMSGRLLLVADQGFGDVIQFSRYIPWALQRCPDTIMVAAPEMAVVLRRFVPPERIFTRETCPAIDAYAALSGLPRLHGTRPDNVPLAAGYLRAEPKRAAAWRERLRLLAPPLHLRVGIVWAGRPAHANDARRSMRLADLAPLGDIPGIVLVSLQKGEPAAQAGRWFGRAPLLNLAAEITDYEDTMALVEALDLVITVDTSVGHLAAALGRPCWILLARAADWRWLRARADSPWYDSVRLFRQDAPMDWSAPVRALAAALRALAR